MPSQDPVAPGGAEPPSDAPPAEAEDETFEFRLFAPTTTAVASNTDQSFTPDVTATQRIILSNSDDEDLGDGAFTIPHRKLSWYIAAPATGARKAEFEEAAVSSEVVWRGREQRAWALEKPWRVTVIRTGSTPIPQPAGRQAAKSISMQVAVEENGKTKRTKPNKKRRIVVRIRERALSEKLEAERLRRAREEEEKATRGVEDAEKRTARNRERKIKRREREKRKKAAAAAGIPEPSGDAESGSDAD